ncbi:MAG: response regulator [Sedimentisphaerales bacterium]|nr:response regulator [Sedimentisphaerales bacterium]
MATLALANIRDIVGWLRNIEETVGNLYTRAAEIFAGDEFFSSFLAQLAEDEKTHEQFMSMILEMLPQRKIPLVVDIVLDKRTRDNVESTLRRFDEQLGKEHISKRQIVEYMARAEFSELNPVFLYIVGIFSEKSRETENIADEIQRHLSDVQEFIGALPEDLRPSIDVGMFPLVREKRFLVVDDHESLRNLVASLLAGKGMVETASGASEGLAKVRKHFYNGIVSDIQMPMMDGIEFYRQSVAYDSRLSSHFLFYSADLSCERENFLKQNNLLFLRKPFGLDEFMDRMEQVLRQ